VKVLHTGSCISHHFAPLAWVATCQDSERRDRVESRSRLLMTPECLEIVAHMAVHLLRLVTRPSITAFCGDESARDPKSMLPPYGCLRWLILRRQVRLKYGLEASQEPFAAK